MSDGGVSEQLYLVYEVQRLKEMASELRSKFLDRFVKEPEKEPSKTEACEPNPIDQCIRVTRETQTIVESCHKLLEEKIITKLEGK